MAFLPQTDKLQGQQQPGQDQQGQTVGSGQAVPLGNSGGGVIGGTSGAAPTGAGGQGSWTNIQAYLDANKGDTGSAGMLSKDASDVYGKEKQNVDQGSQDAQSQAQKQADQVNFSQDQASKIIQDAGQNYSYDQTQPQNQAYSTDTSQLKNALNAQYQGPTNYAYGMSADTQNFGGNLQNPGGFQQIMNGLYNKAGGGNMTQGQLALQNQLDVSNGALNQARQNAIAQYAGLGDYINNDVTSANNAIQGAQNQFTQNQTNLKSYLNNQASAQSAAEKAAEDQARTSYAGDLGGQSGNESAFYALQQEFPGVQYNFPSANLVAQNQTWQGLQDEANIANGTIPSNSWFQDLLNGGGGANDPAAQAQFQTNQQALQNFYNSEESKYANTGDDQKRQYNAIMDILGQGGTPMSQGFDVRGS